MKLFLKRREHSQDEFIQTTLQWSDHNVFDSIERTQIYFSREYDNNRHGKWSPFGELREIV